MKDELKETVLEIISRMTTAEKGELEEFAFSPRYTSFEIPKKSGGMRKLTIPVKELRDVQRKILTGFLYKFPVSQYAHCSVPDRSVATNVAPHKRSIHFLKMDFKDAFPSVTSEMVANTICAATLNGPILPVVGRCDEATAKAVGRLIARLTTFEGRLPQGSPCSPHLMNLVCVPFDREMAAIAKERGLIFTRYMDDNTLSSRHPIGDDDMFRAIQTAAKYGFSANMRKTCLTSASSSYAPTITGVRIEGGEMAIPRKTIEWYRTMIYRAAKDPSIDEGKVFGALSWVMMIEGKLPKRIQRPLRDFLSARCPGKLKDYEKFLKDISDEPDFIF